MQKMFGQDADFSGMTTSRHISISKLQQKSFIDVNEYGVDAAAVTVSSLSTKTSASFKFNCNRPFFFYIRENVTGMKLFMGKVVTF